MKLRLLTLVAMIATVIAASAQILNPVTWTTSVEMTSNTEGVINYTASIEGGMALVFNLPPRRRSQPDLSDLRSARRR